MLYKLYNGPAPTTASFALVTTGTAIKTMMQLKPGTTQVIKVVEWGISFDGSAAGVPIEVELAEMDVAATVTAYLASGIHKYDSEALAAGDPSTNIIAVGTTASGYTASAEGTITAVRLGDVQQIQPTNQFAYQFPLGRAFVIQPSLFGRIRVKAAAAVNAVCYLLVEA
jgi:hypothetical protein